MKKVAIVGGSGFIGTNLIKSLINQDCLIHIYDIVEPEYPNNSCGYTYFDIRDSETDFILLADFDFIYILAALLGKRCNEEPENGWNTNILGINNLMNNIIKFKKKPVIVYTSSCMVYNTSIESIPITEEHPLAVKDLYEISKAYAENLIHSCCRTYGLKGIVFRFFTVFGSGPASSQKGHFIPTWIDSAKNKGEITIFGDGENTIDLTHVDDIAMALTMIMNFDFKPMDYEVFNISTGRETTVKQIALLFKRVQPNLLIRYDNKVIPMAKRKYGDITKARKMIKYNPEVNVLDALLGLLVTRLSL